ncbi:MAG: radical SAM protein, partial [Melioribacteraceae bacterium]
DIRGVIELSNYCSQNCLYCANRDDNYKLLRYRMNPDEIIKTAQIISNLGIQDVVLKSGEDHYFDTDMMAYIIYQIKQKANVAVTLSLGERGFDEYRTWKIAGADRYLLKHRTANPINYAEYHKGHKLDDRISQLRFLKTIGYQTGSGNIVGLPLQNPGDIADDLILFKLLDLDLISIAPFIPSVDTPYQNREEGNMELLLKTLAVARLLLRNVHIAVSVDTDYANFNITENELNTGADVLMPDLTPPHYSDQQKIFRNRSRSAAGPIEKAVLIQKSIEAIGRKLSSGRGDSIKNPSNLTI